MLNNQIANLSLSKQESIIQPFIKMLTNNKIKDCDLLANFIIDMKIIPLDEWVKKNDTNSASIEKELPSFLKRVEQMLEQERVYCHLLFQAFGKFDLRKEINEEVTCWKMYLKLLKNEKSFPKSSMELVCLSKKELFELCKRILALYENEYNKKNVKKSLQLNENENKNKNKKKNVKKKKTKSATQTTTKNQKTRSVKPSTLNTEAGTVGSKDSQSMEVVLFSSEQVTVTCEEDATISKKMALKEFFNKVNRIKSNLTIPIEQYLKQNEGKGFIRQAQDEGLIEPPVTTLINLAGIIEQRLEKNIQVFNDLETAVWCFEPPRPNNLPRLPNPKSLQEKLVQEKMAIVVGFRCNNGFILQNVGEVVEEVRLIGGQIDLMNQVIKKERYKRVKFETEMQEKLDIREKEMQEKFDIREKEMQEKFDIREKEMQKKFDMEMKKNLETLTKRFDEIYGMRNADSKLCQCDCDSCLNCVNKSNTSVH